MSWVNKIKKKKMLRSTEQRTINTPLDLEAYRNRMRELVHDRIGRDIPIEIEEDYSLPTIETAGDLITESNTHIETITLRSERATELLRTSNGRLQLVLDQSGLIHGFWRIVELFSGAPLLQKIILASGLVIVVVGGTYIGYKIIRKFIGVPKTIVSPFGPKMTMFGRIMQAIMYK